MVHAGGIDLHVVPSSDNLPVLYFQFSGLELTTSHLSLHHWISWYFDSSVVERRGGERERDRGEGEREIEERERDRQTDRGRERESVCERVCERECVRERERKYERERE